MVRAGGGGHGRKPVKEETGRTWWWMVQGRVRGKATITTWKLRTELVAAWRQAMRGSSPSPSPPPPDPVHHAGAYLDPPPGPLPALPAGLG